MHGGTNPGAPKGNRNAWKHGGRSAETMAAALYLSEIALLVRELAPEVQRADCPAPKRGSGYADCIDVGFGGGLPGSRR